MTLTAALTLNTLVLRTTAAAISSAWNVAKDAYSRALQRHPLVTQMSTSGGLWGLGDLLAQRLEGNGNNNGKGNNDTKVPSTTDWNRTWNQVVYAAFIWGTMGHVWYAALDNAVRRLRLQQASHRVAVKYLTEAFVHDPVSLAVYFASIGCLSGESANAIRQQMKRDYVPTFWLGFAYWAPLDILNFALVPVRHQLLVVNLGCFCDSVVLSYIKNNGFSWATESC